MFVGIDVAKVSLEVAVPRPADRWTVEDSAGAVATLVDRLTALAPTRIVLEATWGVGGVLRGSPGGRRIPRALAAPDGPVNRLTPRRLWTHLSRRLRRRAYFWAPGDGRIRLAIPAHALLWVLILGQRLRKVSYAGLEALVRSPARPVLAVPRRFGDDALAYPTERLAPGPTRAALAATLRQGKRNKAFEGSALIGLALDGTGPGRSTQARCPLCPRRDTQGRVTAYGHHCCLITVVGKGLTLPFHVEPYGPGDSEHTAGQRLPARAVAAVGRRFADYVVVDGEFATAPFLHGAGDLGLRVVARLKGNLPELFAVAQARFAAQPPTQTCTVGADRVELWGAEDFDPWENLCWPTVRVLRYRQHKPDGTVVEAYWLTDFPASRVSSPTLTRLAKSRWEVENQGINEGKTSHGLAHICHHHANSLLLSRLLALFALTIERLYRLRYLRRGTHRPRPGIEFVRLLRLSLAPPPPDAS